MNPILHDLHNKQWVWTAANVKQEQLKQKRTSGFSNLDKVLSGGFPQAGMIHLHSLLGCGELRLMLGMLQQQKASLPVNKASEKTNIEPESTEQKLYIFINPPFTLNAEFLLDHKVSLKQLVVVHTKTPTDALWTAEQSVKSGACDAVFIWQKQLNHTHVKKLEVAAQQGQSYCIWLQSESAQANSHAKGQTPAQNNLPLSLSLSLTRHKNALQIKVNKQKIGWAQGPIHVSLPFKKRINDAFKKQRDQLQQTNNVIALNAHSSKR